MTTGQAVEAFDRLFRTLYVTSSSVDLRQATTEPEPEPDPVPQPVSVIPPSPAVLRKLYNPKYALVLGNSGTVPSPTPSTGHNTPQKTKSQDSSNPEIQDSKKRRQTKVNKESIQEAPPIHPGLTNLEKACLISYLPIWPEPDPPSDVIGFINIRDTSKPPQVHLQRSEMFETSQAIRFSSPVSIPKEILPEVAKPRQLTAKREEISKAAQPTELKARPDDIRDNVKAPEKNSLTSEQKNKPVNTENKLCSNTLTSQTAGQSTEPHLNEFPSPQSNRRGSTPRPGGSSQAMEAAPTNSPRPDCVPGSNTNEDESSSNTDRQIPESSSTQTSPPTKGPPDTGQHTQRLLPHADSHTQGVQTKPLSLPEMTPNNQTSTIKSKTSPTASSAVPPSSTNLSENARTSPSSSSTSVSPLPSSSSASLPLTSTPPVPKPRTIQLVIKDGITSESQRLPEFPVVQSHKTSTGPLVVPNEPTVAADMEKKSPEKESEMLPELQNRNGNETGSYQDKENMGTFEGAQQQKQTGSAQETKKERAVAPHDNRAELKLVSETNHDSQSGVWMTNTTKAENVNIPKETAALDTTDSLKASRHTPVCAPQNSDTPKDPDDDCTHTNANAAHGQEGRSSFPPARWKDNEPNSAKQNTHGTFQEFPPKPRANTPEKTSLSNTHAKESLSLTPEREMQPFTPSGRVPPPDGFPPQTPTSDSRMHMPDPRSYTPDFRTPTPDVSDGYVSPRTNSTLSTTSEEYYECSDSPFYEPVFERALYCNYGMTEDHVSFTFTNTPEASTTATSPARIHDASATGRDTSSSETQTLSGPSSVVSSSSLLEENVRKGEEEMEDKNEWKVEERAPKVSVAERKTEGGSQETHSGGSEESRVPADHFEQGQDLTGKDQITDNQPQTPRKKRPLSQSAAERLAGGGVTPGGLTNEKAEPKRLATGDLKPKRTSSEAEGPDRETAAALGSSSPVRKGKLQSAKEVQKVGGVTADVFLLKICLSVILVLGCVCVRMHVSVC